MSDEVLVFAGLLVLAVVLVLLISERAIMIPI